jgi:hypothetical protein
MSYSSSEPTDPRGIGCRRPDGWILCMTQEQIPDLNSSLKGGYMLELTPIQFFDAEFNNHQTISIPALSPENDVPVRRAIALVKEANEELAGGWRWENDSIRYRNFRLRLSLLDLTGAVAGVLVD